MRNAQGGFFRRVCGKLCRRRCRAVGFVPFRPCFRGGIPVAYLLHGGLFAAVGKHNAVATECVIGLPLAKVAAVAEHPFAVRVNVPERLIHIVPDKAALVLLEFLAKPDIAFHPAQ